MRKLPRPLRLALLAPAVTLSLLSSAQFGRLLRE